MGRRWPLYASIALLGCGCLAYIVAGSTEWAGRGAMAGIDSTEAAEQARIAVELYAIAGLSLLALVGFLLRRSGWGWWIALGTQVVIFVVALIQGMLTDLGWVWVSALPLLTVLLLLAFRKMPEKQLVSAQPATRTTAS